MCCSEQATALAAAALAATAAEVLLDASMVDDPARMAGSMQGAIEGQLTAFAALRRSHDDRHQFRRSVDGLTGLSQSSSSLHLHGSRADSRWPSVDGHHRLPASSGPSRASMEISAASRASLDVMRASLEFSRSASRLTFPSEGEGAGSNMHLVPCTTKCMAFGFGHGPRSGTQHKLTAVGS